MICKGSSFLLLNFYTTHLKFLTISSLNLIIHKGRGGGGGGAKFPHHSIFSFITFFSKVELAFTVSALFHEQMLFFVYVLCQNNEYILGNTSRIWVREKKLTLIDFSNNTFPIDAVVVSLANYIWVVRFIHNNT